MHPCQAVRRFALVLSATLFVVALSTPSALAQNSAPKVAVIDTQQILIDSQTGKKVLAELKKLQEAKEAELQAMAQEIKDLQTKLEAGRLSLAQDKLSEMEKQLEDRTISLRRGQDDATRELNKKRDEMFDSVDKKVMPIINQIGKEGAYTLIFRKFESGLIFADSSTDITPLIIQKLDAGDGK
jgi:outer membrane protein